MAYVCRNILKMEFRRVKGVTKQNSIKDAMDENELKKEVEWSIHDIGQIP